MPNPVIHFEIQVNDVEAGQEFYRKLFDWDINADNPMNYGGGGHAGRGHQRRSDDGSRGATGHILCGRRRPSRLSGTGRRVWAERPSCLPRRYLEW